MNPSPTPCSLPGLAHPSHHQAPVPPLLLQTDAIPRFVDMLHSSNMGSKRASAWALRHLAAIDENRVLMVEQGAIEPLLKLLEEDSSGDEQVDEAQTAAIGALQILAVNDECSKQIAALGGVVSLVRCLKRGSDFCKVRQWPSPPAITLRATVIATIFLPEQIAARTATVNTSITLTVHITSIAITVKPSPPSAL